MGVYLHTLLTSALVGGKWTASNPSCFTPVNGAPSTQWRGGCVGPRAGSGCSGKKKSLPLLGIEPQLFSP